MKRAWLLELALVVLAALALHARTYVDPDLGWALDAGARILHGDGVPVVNDRAFIDLAHPVILHGWALDTLFALAQHAFGGAGLALARLAFVVADTAAVYFAIARATKSSLLRVALAVGAVAVSPAFFMLVRAQLVSFALLALVTAALVVATVDEGRRRRALWAMVPLFALWPNVHGAFPAGLGVVVAYCGGVVVEQALKRRARDESARPLRELVVDVVGLPLACFVATLATPYGLHLWTMVRSTTDANFAELLPEWFPVWNPVTLHLYGATYAALAAGVVVALVFLPRRDVKLRFVVVAMALLTATAVRHTRVCPAVLAPIVALALARFVERPIENPRRALTALAAAALVPAAALVWQASSLLALQPRGIGTPPATTTAFLVDNGLHGNVWTTLETGGLVLWACRACNVSIDGRAQVAYEPAWFAHVLRHPLPDKALLVEKKTDYAIVFAHQEILSALAPEFFPLYCDGTLCVLSGHAEDRARSYRFPPESLDDGVLFSRPGRPAD